MIHRISCELRRKRAPQRPSWPAPKRAYVSIDSVFKPVVWDTFEEDRRVSYKLMNRIAVFERVARNDKVY